MAPFARLDERVPHKSTPNLFDDVFEPPLCPQRPVGNGSLSGSVCRALIKNGRGISPPERGFRLAPAGAWPAAV